MRLVWITDAHLDLLPSAEPRRFGERVSVQHADADALVLTGDIAQCTSLQRCLVDFVQGWGRSVYFVLGNHDLWGGSMEAAARAAHAVEAATERRARWLTRAGVVELSSEAVLVGHDGWYDARLGAPETTPVELPDFYVIDELKGLGRRELLAQVRVMADRAAAEAEPVLRAAAERSRRVTFATHVPPFREACWHQGAISDDQWMPWFTSKAMGDVLLAVADAHPQTAFAVLCGHTHGEGRALLRPNLEVLTGKARYGAPEVHRVLQIP